MNNHPPSEKSNALAAIAAQIKQEIDAAKRILLHCHVSPDPDSVGSATAMYQALKGLGKDVLVIQGDSPVPKAFKDIPSVGDISQKNFFEVDLSSIDLFIILDSASIDRISILKPVELPTGLKTIVIDHHISNTKFAEINYVDPSSAATCEILYKLFKSWDIDMTPGIATSLFTGIYTDTGGFKYDSTVPETLAIASELARIAPNFAKPLLTMENSNTREKLIFEGLALSDIRLECGGKLAIAVVSHKDLVSNNIGREDMSSHTISNMLKSVEGWDIGLCMIEVEPSVIKMSFRTRDSQKYDLSKVATALGGGGHKGAAGVHMHATIPEAIEKVKAVVGALIEGEK